MPTAWPLTNAHSTNASNQGSSSPSFTHVRVRGASQDHSHPLADLPRTETRLSDTYRAHDDDVNKAVAAADHRRAAGATAAPTMAKPVAPAFASDHLKDYMDRLRTTRPWRLITKWTGGLFLMLFVGTSLLALLRGASMGTSSNGDGGSVKPISNASRHPSWIVRPPVVKKLRAPQYSLTPEEEAMFGQYQAVGLGNESLQEAYAPAPRHYVAPPGGDIYSTFGIVMASFRPHATMLSRFFDSMAKYCLDCHRVRIVVIIPSKEVDFFNDIRNEHMETLPGLEFVPFTHVFPALNDTLAKSTPGWPTGWMGWDEDRFLKATDKSLYQSFKKVYGCLYLAKEYCMFLDSEGFFIRPATLADIYGGFRKSPYVVYSSYLRHRYFATETAQKLLGYYENWGWALEEYNWSMDTNIVAELERLFRRDHPTLEQMEPLVFFEVVYWVYMMHNHHRYPQLRILDTANLFGINTLEHMRKLANYDDIWFTPWEDLRWYMEKDPKLVDVAVTVFNKHKFKIFKTGKNNESIALLERSPSIVLCVSEQPDNVYEMAMKGHFAKPLVDQGADKQESRDRKVGS